MRKDVVIAWGMGPVPEKSKAEFTGPTEFITLPTPAGQAYRQQAYDLGWPHPIKGILRKYAPGVEPNRIALLGFSESCQGPRALLRSRDAGLVDTVIAIDGIHAQYEANKIPSRAMMAPWYAYASLAAGRASPQNEGIIPGQRHLVVTHSSIKPPFVSTSETAAAILTAVFGTSWPGPCPFPDFEGGYTEQPPYVSPAGSLSSGVQYPRVVYEHPPFAYSVCEAGLAVFGYHNADPTGIGDHKYQAQRILPRAVEQLLAWRWNDEPVSAGVGVGNFVGNPQAGVVVTQDAWEQDTDQSIPWEEYAGIGGGEPGGGNGDGGGGGEIVPIDVKEPEPTSQGVSAGGLILSIVLGGALGFAGAHLARRALENA